MNFLRNLSQLEEDLAQPFLGLIRFRLDKISVLEKELFLDALSFEGQDAAQVLQVNVAQMESNVIQ